jgi:two-component system response regulator YesN
LFKGIWGRKGRSIILTWLFSYMAILLLPIAMSMIVYNESVSTLKEEINNANASLLTQVREIADNQFTNMKRLSFQVQWNARVLDLFTPGRDLSKDKDYDYEIYQITQDLKAYKNAYSFIDEFYIYIASNNTVLLPGLVRSGNLLYSLEHEAAKYTYEDWLATMNHPYKGFISMNHIGEDGINRKAVAYLHNFNSVNKDQPNGMNVTIIDQSQILKSIESVQLFNKGKVLILNSKNEILISNDNSAVKLPVDFPYNQLTEGSDTFFMKRGNQNYEVTYIQSPQTEVKYVSIIPSSLFFQKAEHVRFFTYTSILISMFGGIVMTYFFTRKNYNPIRRLLRTLDDKSEGSRDKKGNEFQYIEQAIGQTFVKMDDIKLKMKQHHPILRSNFITRLLKGKGDSQIPLDEAMIAYDLEFHSDQFAVLLFLAEETELFYEKFHGVEPWVKQKMLQFIIANVVEELANRKHHGYVAEVEDTAACLLNLTDERENHWKEDMLEIAKEAQLFLNQAYHIQITVSISSVHSSMEGINRSYMEALDALEYKLVMGRKEIITFDQIYQDSLLETQTGYYYPLAVEQQLINFVKIGDFGKAKASFDDIMEHNLDKVIQPVQLVKCLMFDLTSTLIKTINEIGDIQETFLAQNPKAIEKLVDSVNIQDMQNQFTNILQKVCLYTAEKRQMNIQLTRQRTIASLVEQVKDFIEGRYQDGSLNISLIGEFMEMKPAYVSKLFKDQNGEGLVDFINKFRIDKAKLIFGNQDLNIHEVANKVGFADVTSFIRAFKKYEGITPGKYKDSLDL